MEVKCQNQRCGRYFVSRTEKAECCSPKCYAEKRKFNSLEWKITQFFSHPNVIEI